MNIVFNNYSKFLWLILIVTAINCKSNGNKAKKSANTKTITTLKAPSVKYTIHIQPFSDLPPQQLQYVLNKLKTILPDIQLKPNIQIPNAAYYKPRDRYDADFIIAWLRNRTPANQITVGITSLDIYGKNDKSPYFGIMGKGYQPGNACVASSHRLKKNKNESLFKIVIHELGHNHGLPHCPVTTCFMRDANGKNITAEVKEFCVNCKRKLVERGWFL